MESTICTRKGIAGLLIAVLISNAVLAGTIIHVDPQAPGANDGSSWTDAYICLQNALESAQPTDEVRVAQGVYRPDQRTVTLLSGDNRYVKSSRDVDETFRLPEGVVIKGGYAGYDDSRPDTRDVKTYRSILTGDLRSDDTDLEATDLWGLYGFVRDATLKDNSRTVVTASGVTDSTVLDGFTITAGRAVGGTEQADPNAGTFYRKPTFDPAMDGAGVFIDSGNPWFIQCTFTRNTTRSLNYGASGGAGVACVNASPGFEDCVFSENIAFADGLDACSYGGGLLCSNSSPGLLRCTFTDNVAAGFDGQYAGGAAACIASETRLIDCSFVGNRAIASYGGAVFSTHEGAVRLEKCHFEKNSALHGGGLCSEGLSGAFLIDCVFWANKAFDARAQSSTDDNVQDDTSGNRSGSIDSDPNNTGSSGGGGAIYERSAQGVTVHGCRFLGNTATGSGGAVWGSGEPGFVNCLFSGNTAQRGGALSLSFSELASMSGCTFTANCASSRGASYYCSGRSTLSITNCILWDEHPVGDTSATSSVSIQYSNVQGGGTLSRDHNIDADPRFQDPAGPDGVPGTLDDDLRLSVGSPCIDVGLNTAMMETISGDLAGRPRIVNGTVDMGAYEFDGPYNYYVDGLAGDDAAEGYNRHHAFATIQRGIEAAQEGYTVVVLPGVYTEEVNFDGKAITVAGAEGGVVLGAPDEYGVSFYSAERSTSVLKNIAIQNCDVGIFIAGASPTIQNVTLANNKFGIAAYAGAVPDISNCILWGNHDGDLFGCTARFSCTEDPIEGEGNIRQDPLFADAENGDYHLLSERGRFVPAYDLWAFDEKTSPCVDAGDPFRSPGAERGPNGGRLNMGAFGGTPEASLSEWPLIGDLNRDGIVDQNDLDILNELWLETLPGVDGVAPEVNLLQPNPTRWAIDGQPREVAGDGGAFDYYAEMTVGEVVSPNGPVEYFFQCDQTGFDSDWQTERTYTVLVGRTGQGLRFRVRARDQSGNMTDWSDWATALPEAVIR